ncbi:MAG: Gfo/Idh/MocA family oxidoreductase, partial [Clostridia bacterium]|nr:Gfo/Idh/MocA family oxidoreductase [Clostridia bacterium]
MKAAMIGAGFISDFHVNGYRSAEDVTLCAVCDTDAEKARALAQKAGCGWYTDAETMLRRERPDLVSVCLPTFLHERYATLALGYGAHVLCEKPLALTKEERARILAAQAASGKVFMTGQVVRWWPEYARIASLTKRLGKPRFVRAQRLAHAMRAGWLLDPLKGGGALYDLFVHDVDYVCSLLGTDAEVMAVNGSKGAEGSWRRVSAMLAWPGGAYAEIEACNSMPEGFPFTVSLRAEYENACIDYSFRAPVNIQRDAPTQAQLLLYENGGVTALPLQQDAQGKAFANEIAAFVEAAQSGVSPLPAVETCAVMD